MMIQGEMCIFVAASAYKRKCVCGIITMLCVFVRPFDPCSYYDSYIYHTFSFFSQATPEQHNDSSTQFKNTVCQRIVLVLYLYDPRLSHHWIYVRTRTPLSSVFSPVQKEKQKHLFLHCKNGSSSRKNELIYCIFLERSSSTSNLSKCVLSLHFIL